MLSDVISVIDPGLYIFPFLAVIYISLWSAPRSIAVATWYRGVLNLVTRYWESASRFKSFNSILGRILFLILILNRFGLIPNVFAYTAIPAFTLRVGLLLWLALLLSSVVSDYKHQLSLLVPLGAPSYLAPLLTLVETVRLFIRPVSLSLRLLANITAGHVMLGLLSLLIMKQASLIFVGVLYCAVELAVAVIQAYVLTLLLNIYQQEHAF